MYAWARPRYAIPVHGEARHLEEHAEFALELGAEEALAPRNGDLIRVAPGAPEVIEEVPSGRLYLDGKMLTPEGASPMRERRKLGFAGMVAVAIALDSGGEIAAALVVTAFGAPKQDEDGDDLIDRMAEAAEDGVQSVQRKKRQDDEAVVIAVERAVRNVMSEVWGKRPIVKVLISRV